MAGSARTQRAIHVSARHRGTCCRALPRYWPSVSCWRSRSPVGTEAGTESAQSYEPLMEEGNVDSVVQDGNVARILAGGRGSGVRRAVSLEAVVWAPPVFVVGCPRSGTTLVQTMLDSHPRLSVLYEANFLVD